MGKLYLLRTLSVMNTEKMCVCVCSAAITKFSRYNESSSDSEETDASDSESSSTDSDDDGPSTSPRSVSLPRADTTNSNASPTNDRSTSGSEASESVREQSSVQQLTGADTSAELNDLPTEENRSRHSSASSKSESSSLSSVGDQPSPLRAPLQLESTGQPPEERQKSIWACRQTDEASARKSPTRNYESSPSYSRHSLQPSVRGERSPIQTSNSIRSHLVKSYASASDLQPLSHAVGERLSAPRHLASEKSRLQLTSGDRSSDEQYVPRPYTSERRSPSPPRFHKGDIVDRSTHGLGPDNISRSSSRSPSARKSPSSRDFSPHQQRLRSVEKKLPRSPCSRSSSRSYRGSRSKSRSHSRERFAGSSAIQSSSDSRSRLPVQRSPYRRRTRSRSASYNGERFPPHLDSQAAGRSGKLPSRYPLADPNKDAVRRQTLRSSSKERTWQSRHPEDLHPHRSAESRELSPSRSSFSRSPDRPMQRTDTKPSSRPVRVESPLSSSQSSPRNRSPVPASSDEKFARKNLSPDRCEKKNPKDSRQNSEKYRFGHSIAKPEERVSRTLQPEVRDRLSPLTFDVRKHNLASQARSPDNKPSGQRGRVHDRLGRSPQRTNEVVRSRLRNRTLSPLTDSESAERKTNLQYSRERHRLVKQTENLPVSSVTKPAEKAKIPGSLQDKSQASTRGKYRQVFTHLPPKLQKMSADKAEDSSVVGRLKKLAEPDKFVGEKEDTRDKSARSASKECSHLQKAQTLPATSESACAESEKASTHKAVTLKRPPASATAVLEARKRRFEQTRDADSRSVCIRSSSAAEAESRAKHRKKFSPIQYDKSKQSIRDAKQAVTADTNAVRSKVEESGVERSSGKLRMDASMSDISDQSSSADSSMSLEDISEDEAPRGRDKHFIERTDLSSTEQQSGSGMEKTSKVRKQRRTNSKDAASSRTSAVSSVVRPVQKDAGATKALRSVQTDTELASKAQSGTDKLSATGDGISGKAAVQKGSKG